MNHSEGAGNRSCIIAALVLSADLICISAGKAQEMDPLCEVGGGILQVCGQDLVKRQGRGNLVVIGLEW
jgi:hypothetical protein